jgi:hypothetical protein
MKTIVHENIGSGGVNTGVLRFLLQTIQERW